MRLQPIVLALALAFAAAGAALADGDLAARMTAADKARLAGFDANRAAAVAEARVGGAAADIAVLETMLEGDAMGLRDGCDPTGA